MTESWKPSTLAGTSQGVTTSVKNTRCNYFWIGSNRISETFSTTNCLWHWYTHFLSNNYYADYFIGNRNTLHVSQYNFNFTLNQQMQVSLITGKIPQCLMRSLPYALRIQSHRKTILSLQLLCIYVGTELIDNATQLANYSLWWSKWSYINNSS